MTARSAYEVLGQSEREEVRRRVRKTLESTDSFRAQPPEERKKIAHNMVRVMSYLSDPYAGHGDLRATGAGQREAPVAPGAAIASAMAAPPAPRPRPGNFGPATQSVAGVMGATEDAVNFVDFVSGLIEGVFTSIVNSSIRQMQEFAKFLEAVVKSAKDFMDDNVTDQQGKDQLAQQFPKAINQKDDGSIALSSDLDDAEMPNFAALFGLASPPSNDDPASMQQLVDAARLKMARQRQQQLSSMLLMGINRIVVTEGEIKASVLIDITSKDTTHREAERGNDQTRTDVATRQTTQNNGGGGTWGGGGNSSSDNSQRTAINVSTAHTRMENKSDSTLEAHAKLAGSVLVRFKSETFPLEKLASSAELAAVQQQSEKT